MNLFTKNVIRIKKLSILLLLCSFTLTTFANNVICVSGRGTNQEIAVLDALMLAVSRKNKTLTSGVENLNNDNYNNQQTTNSFGNISSFEILGSNNLGKDGIQVILAVSFNSSNASSNTEELSNLQIWNLAQQLKYFNVALNQIREIFNNHPFETIIHNYTFIPIEGKNKQCRLEQQFDIYINKTLYKAQMSLLANLLDIYCVSKSYIPYSTFQKNRYLIANEAPGTNKQIYITNENFSKVTKYIVPNQFFETINHCLKDRNFYYKSLFYNQNHTQVLSYWSGLNSYELKYYTPYNNAIVISPIFEDKRHKISRKVKITLTIDEIKNLSKCYVKYPIFITYDYYRKNNKISNQIVASTNQSNRYRTIKATGFGDTIEASEKDAVKEAVISACGSEISSKTLLKNEEIKSDKVVSQNIGLIKNYKVVQSTTKRGVYICTISANVNLNKLVVNTRREELSNIDFTIAKNILSNNLAHKDNGIKVAQEIRKSCYGLFKTKLLGQITMSPDAKIENSHVSGLNCKIRIYTDLNLYRQIINNITPYIVQSSVSSYKVNLYGNSNNIANVLKLPQNSANQNYNNQKTYAKQQVYQPRNNNSNNHYNNSNQRYNKRYNNNKSFTKRYKSRRSRNSYLDERYNNGIDRSRTIPPRYSNRKTNYNNNNSNITIVFNKRTANNNNQLNNNYTQSSTSSKKHKLSIVYLNNNNRPMYVTVYTMQDKFMEGFNEVLQHHKNKRANWVAAQNYSQDDFMYLYSYFYNKNNKLIDKNTVKFIRSNLPISLISNIWNPFPYKGKSFSDITVKIDVNLSDLNEGNIHCVSEVIHGFREPYFDDLSMDDFNTFEYNNLIDRKSPFYGHKYYYLQEVLKKRGTVNQPVSEYATYYSHVADNTLLSNDWQNGGIGFVPSIKAINGAFEVLSMSPYSTILQGDKVYSFNDKTFTDVIELFNYLKALPPGEKIVIKTNRGNKSIILPPKNMEQNYWQKQFPIGQSLTPAIAKKKSNNFIDTKARDLYNQKKYVDSWYETKNKKPADVELLENLAYTFYDKYDELKNAILKKREGTRYMSGFGGDEEMDDINPIPKAEHAMNNGSALGAYIFALTCFNAQRNQQFTSKDYVYRTFRENLTKAYQMGSSDAANHLACLYERGEGVNRHYNLALAIFKEAATYNNHLAELNIGKFYLYGWGNFKKKINNFKAIYWLKRSAEHGNKEAENLLKTLQ